MFTVFETTFGVDPKKQDEEIGSSEGALEAARICLNPPPGFDINSAGIPGPNPVRIIPTRAAIAEALERNDSVAVVFSPSVEAMLKPGFSAHDAVAIVSRQILKQ